MQSDTLKVKGTLEIFVKRAGTDAFKFHSKVENTTQASLKELIRDTLAADQVGQYMGSNGFFASNVQAGTGGSVQGQDGITVAEAVGMDDGWTMITAVHPSNPSGNYYKQWQGLYTATGATTMTQAWLGRDWDGPDVSFDKRWSIATLAAPVVLATSDIIQVNWKISVA